MEDMDIVMEDMDIAMVDMDIAMVDMDIAMDLLRESQLQKSEKNTVRDSIRFGMMTMMKTKAFSDQQSKN